MGLLDYIIQSGQATKRNIRSLLDDPSGYANALLNRGVENTQAHLNKLTGKPYNQGNDQAYQDAMNEAALAALTVYHGSPHKFDKFDMNKIGTGEGAQAYGHGLYMAESPGVAQSYADALSSKGHPLIAQRTQEIINKFEGNESQAKDYIKQAVDYYKNKNRLGDAGFWQRALDDFDSYKNYGKGQMYKVDIPDEAIPRMLDWDKPLSEQAPEVLAAAKNLGIKDAANGEDLLWKIKRTKYDTRAAMQGNTGLNEAGAYATQQLKQQGVPGIRYLDGGSRTAGTGTSNFVLFDDQLPRILERNGVPMGNKPWAPGEYTGLLGR